MTNITPRESVEACLRVLDPPESWDPVPAIALARFRARVEDAEATRARRSSRAWSWLAAVGAVCLVLVMMPATRAGAQRLWDVFFSQRVEMVLGGLRETLKRLGIEAVDPKGEKFDPNRHEALSTMPVEGTESGVVVEVMQKGYLLGEQLIRPARVVVSA